MYHLVRYDHKITPVFARPVTSGHFVVGYATGELYGFTGTSYGTFAQDKRLSRDQGAALAADAAGEVFVVQPFPSDTDRRLKLLRVLSSGAGQLARLDGTAEGVTCCTVSADGSTVLVGYASGELVAWDTTAALPARMKPAIGVQHMPPLMTGMLALLLTANALQQLATAGAAGTVVANSNQPVVSCCISPDGRHAAAGWADGSIHIWERADSQPVHALHLVASHQLPAAVTACEFSQSGPSHLAIGCANGSVWHSAGAQQHPGRDIEVVPGPVHCGSHQHPAPVRCCSFSADGQLLATGCDGGQVVVWDRTSSAGPEPQAAIITQAHRNPILTCHFPPAQLNTPLIGHVVISCSRDGVTVLNNYARPVRGSDGMWYMAKPGAWSTSEPPSKLAAASVEQQQQQQQQQHPAPWLQVASPAGGQPSAGIAAMFTLPGHSTWSPRIWALFKDGRAGVFDNGRWHELWSRRASDLYVDDSCAEILPCSVEHSTVPPLPRPEEAEVACARSAQALDDGTEDVALPGLVAVAYSSGHVAVLNTTTGVPLSPGRCACRRAGHHNHMMLVTIPCMPQLLPLIQSCWTLRSFLLEDMVIDDLLICDCTRWAPDAA